MRYVTYSIGYSIPKQQILDLREFGSLSKTHIILAPGASEVGLRAAALAPLRRDTALRGIPGLSSARSLSMRRRTT